MLAPKIKKQMLNNRLCKAGKIKILYHGIRKSLFPQEISYPDKELVFISPVRIAKEKRIDRLLAGFLLLCKNNPAYFARIKLFIMGSGPLEGWLRRKLKSLPPDFQKRVQYLGFRDDVFEQYKLADFVIISSDYEGLPLCLMEAACFGVVPIYGRWLGINDVFEGACIEIEKPSPFSIYRTLLKLCSMGADDIRKGKEEAFELAKNKFVLERNADIFMKGLLYEL